MSENDSTIQDEDGDFSDWIELYNAGSDAIDLEGFKVSDELEDPDKWEFPSVILGSGEHLMVFCSGKDRLTGPYFHTNFKLKSAGEPLILSNLQGEVLDSLKPKPLGSDYCYARVTDGAGSWERFDQSTPELSNNSNSGVIFSHGAGFYLSDFNLELSSNLNQEIRYTLDGAIPDTNSLLYLDPISLSDLSGSPNVISNISISQYWQSPTGTFPKINVIRARTFLNGEPTSQIFSKTFIIDDEVHDYQLDFPVVSILTDSLNLFDFDSGLFVPGANFDSSNTVWTGNYFMKGEEWERNAHVEYFENFELAWSQNFGLRVHGGKSRNAPQKSLRMYAREEMGAKKFHHQFFDTKVKTVFDKFVLRAHYGCWNQTMIKDGLTAYVVRDLDFDSQHSKPTIVFINGEYWGGTDRARLL